MKYFYDWYNPTRELFKKYGRAKIVRGMVKHYWHPSTRKWSYASGAIKKVDYKLNESLIRHDNWLITVKEGAELLSLFPKQK